MAYRGWALGMGFTDTHSQIGIATSSDGISFRKNPDNPIMKYGPLNLWDEYGLLAPRMWFDEDGYHMNYSGESNGTTSKPAISIDHAFATKLRNWTKSSKNSIIFSGDTKWHDLEWGTVIKDGDCWKMLTTA